jgi:hypothetical protein
MGNPPFDFAQKPFPICAPNVLDKLSVGLRSCTARVCLGRLLETLVFYELWGGVRVWQAGRRADLGSSRGLSWGLSGPPLGPQTDPKSTPNDRDRTSDNLELQPQELQPYP